MKYVLEVLYPYIVFLYLIDCIIYVKKHHLLLTSFIGKRFKLRSSGFKLSGLIPFSQNILTHNLPVYFGNNGLYVVFDNSYSYNEIYKADDFHLFPYKDINSIAADGKNIKINKKEIIKTPSSLVANNFVTLLNELKKLNGSKRTDKIKAFLKESFDITEIKKLATFYSNTLITLKTCSSYLFLLVFLLLPLVLYSNLYQFINLDILVFCIVCAYLIILFFTFSAYKKINSADNKFKFNEQWSIIFSPVNAIHIVGYFTKNLFYKFDYLTIAANFAPRDSFKELARKEFFLLDYYKNQTKKQEWKKLLELKSTLLQNLVRSRGFSIEEFSIKPKKVDPSAIFYCPYCMTEYRGKRDNCVDCKIGIVKFE